MGAGRERKIGCRAAAYLSPGELTVEPLPAAHEALPEPDARVAVAAVVRAVLHLPAVVLLRELVDVEGVPRAVRAAQQGRLRQLVPAGDHNGFGVLGY